MSALLESVTGLLEGWGHWAREKVMALLNGFFPPERRAELLDKLKAWTVKHPKVTAFLLTNTALSGFPLFLFIMLGITIFAFSLVLAIVIALVLTVLFVLSALGIALMFFFPIIFFTTLTACFVFLLGLAGYWIFKKFNKGEPGAPGDAIGDKINDMTGGKLNYFMGQARESLAEDKLGDAQKVWSRGPSGYYGDDAHQGNTNGDSKESSKEKPSTNGNTNGAPKKKSANADHSSSNGNSNGTSNGTPKKAASGDQGKATTSGSDAKSHATNAADGVKKNVSTNGVNNAANQASKAPGVNEVSGTVKGTPKKLNNAAGTVKGATGAVGGLT
ncbi:hypothetical protein MBLNU457_1722t1 [Dothideomycetes sp. NU457]